MASSPSRSTKQDLLAAVQNAVKLLLRNTFENHNNQQHTVQTFSPQLHSLCTAIIQVLSHGLTPGLSFYEVLLCLRPYVAGLQASTTLEFVLSSLNRGDLPLVLRAVRAKRMLYSSFFFADALILNDDDWALFESFLVPLQTLSFTVLPPAASELDISLSGAVGSSPSPSSSSSSSSLLLSLSSSSSSSLLLSSTSNIVQSSPMSKGGDFSAERSHSQAETDDSALIVTRISSRRRTTASSASSSGDIKKKKKKKPDSANTKPKLASQQMQITESSLVHSDLAESPSANNPQLVPPQDIASSPSSNNPQLVPPQDTASSPSSNNPQLVPPQDTASSPVSLAVTNNPNLDEIKDLSTTNDEVNPSLVNEPVADEQPSNTISNDLPIGKTCAQPQDDSPALAAPTLPDFYPESQQEATLVPPCPIEIQLDQTTIGEAVLTSAAQTLTQQPSLPSQIQTSDSDTGSPPPTVDIHSCGSVSCQLERDEKTDGDIPHNAETSFEDKSKVLETPIDRTDAISVKHASLLAQELEHTSENLIAYSGSSTSVSQFTSVQENRTEDQEFSTEDNDDMMQLDEIVMKSVTARSSALSSNTVSSELKADSQQYEDMHYDTNVATLPHDIATTTSSQYPVIKSRYMITRTSNLEKSDFETPVLSLSRTLLTIARLENHQPEATRFPKLLDEDRLFESTMSQLRLQNFLKRRFFQLSCAPQPSAESPKDTQPSYGSFLDQSHAISSGLDIPSEKNELSDAQPAESASTASVSSSIDISVLMGSVRNDEAASVQQELGDDDEVHSHNSDGFSFVGSASPSHTMSSSPSRTDSLQISGRRLKLLLDPPAGNGITIISTKKGTKSQDKQVVFSKKDQLLQQNGRCASCEQTLKSVFGRILDSRTCYYTHQCFCSQCHHHDTFVIPWMIVQFWDFTKKGVSTMAYEYLQNIYDQPLICVSAVNPRLFDEISQLRQCRQVRLRLVLQYEVLQGCPHRREFMREMGATDMEHFFLNTELYSLKNLVELKPEDSPLNKKLEDICSHLNMHIVSCKYCEGRAKGQCPVCEDHTPLWVFDTENVTSCPNCRSMFHSKCFARTRCPICFPAKRLSAPVSQ